MSHQNKDLSERSPACLKHGGLRLLIIHTAELTDIHLSSPLRAAPVPTPILLTARVFRSQGVQALGSILLSQEVLQEVYYLKLAAEQLVFLSGVLFRRKVEAGNILTSLYYRPTKLPSTTLTISAAQYLNRRTQEQSLALERLAPILNIPSQTQPGSGLAALPPPAGL